MTIAFRPMLPADRQFVLSGWSSSYRTSPHAGLISFDTWADVMHRELGAILDLTSTAVTVACEPGELDHEQREFLYGFIAVRSGTWPYVYYVYVKKAYRHPKPYRIGRKLFEAAGIDLRKPFEYASRTNIGDQILAMCECGKHRHDHDGEIECRRFVPKFRGDWDSMPARATRYRNQPMKESA